MRSRPTRPRSERVRRLPTLEAVEQRIVVSDSLSSLLLGIGVPAALNGGTSDSSEAVDRAVLGRRPKWLSIAYAAEAARAHEFSVGTTDDSDNHNHAPNVGSSTPPRPREASSEDWLVLSDEPSEEEAEPTRFSLASGGGIRNGGLATNTGASAFGQILPFRMPATSAGRTAEPIDPHVSTDSFGAGGSATLAESSGDSGGYDSGGSGGYDSGGGDYGDSGGNDSGGGCYIDPTAGDDDYIESHDVTLTVSAPGVLSNDWSEHGGGELTAVVASDPSHGDLTLNADGGFTYVPDPGYVSPPGSPDSFTYYAVDACGSSTEATVTIDILNTAPYAYDDEAYTDGSTVEVAVLENDSDDEGDPLVVESFMQGSHGTVERVSTDTSDPDYNVLKYTPEPELFEKGNYQDVINVSVTDGFTTTLSVLSIQGVEGDWTAWPGGQTETNLNPTEKFTSADFGFTGSVTWDVGGGNVGATIVDASASGDWIQVRYDTKSPTSAQAETAWVQATKDGMTVTKMRTVFKANWAAPNFNGPLDKDNDLTFAPKHGSPTTSAGFNWAGENGATVVAAKMEGRLEFTPTGIDWGARGVSFVYGQGGNAERSFSLERDTRVQAVAQLMEPRAPAGDTRSRLRVPGDGGQWVTDGVPIEGDTQYPSPLLPDKAFVIDAPETNHKIFQQFAHRRDLRDYAAWRTEDGWVQVTPYLEWHVNQTGVYDLSQGQGRFHAVKGGLNNHGAGVAATDIPNARPIASPGPAQTVASGDLVTLDGRNSQDPDNDYIVPEWTQTAGPPVNLSHANSFMPTFTAPQVQDTTDLTFQLIIKDITTQLESHNPDNGTSDPSTVTVTVLEDIPPPPP